MNQKNIKFIILIYVISYLIILISPNDTGILVHNLALPSLGILAGLLIGAVGVFLGSLGNLYTLLQLKTDTKIEGLQTFFSLIEKTVNEVKHNVLFTISALAAVLILPLLKCGNIAFIKWPIASRWFTKDIFFTSVTLCLIILAFRAIIDSVLAMFKLHEHYKEVIKKSLNK